MVPAAVPRIAFGTTSDEDQYMVIDGGNTNRFITINDFFIATSSVYNQGLYYDVSEERIGIHTSTPLHDFTVNGNVAFENTNYHKAISRVQTANFNIENFQTFPVDTTGSVVTGTLPGLTSEDQIGLTYTIKDYAGSGSTNNIVIEPSGSQEIDGGTAAKIQTDYGALTLTAFSSSLGYSWAIVSAT